MMSLNNKRLKNPSFTNQNEIAAEFFCRQFDEIFLPPIIYMEPNEFY
jgi:hypothetical protein